MFVVVWTDSQPCQPITAGELMLVGAYAMRGSNAMVALIDYSRRFLPNYVARHLPLIDSIVFQY